MPVLASHFQALHELITARRETVQLFRERHSRSLLLDAFHLWQQFTFGPPLHDLDRSAQLHVLRADQWYQTSQIRFMFNRWCAMQRAARFRNRIFARVCYTYFSAWRSHVQRQQNRRATALLAWQPHTRLLLLRQYFAAVQTHARMQRVACAAADSMLKHRSKQHLRMVFDHFKTALVSAAMAKRASIAALDRRRAHAIQVISFRRWCHHFKESQLQSKRQRLKNLEEIGQNNRKRILSRDVLYTWCKLASDVERARRLCLGNVLQRSYRLWKQSWLRSTMLCQKHDQHRFVAMVMIVV
jgi:hypothetical protein